MVCSILCEGDLDRPGIGGVESREVDEDDGPPFLDIEHSGEVLVEGIEERNLPIEMFGELREHDPELRPGIGQSQQLADEEMAGGLEGFPGFLRHQGGVDLAHAGKGERGILLEPFPDLLQGGADCRRPVLPADEDSVDGAAGMSNDDIDGTGSDDVLREALDEPEWDFRGTMRGIPVGDFQQEDLNEAAHEFLRFDIAGDFDLVLPTIAEHSDADDRAVRRRACPGSPGRGWGRTRCRPRPTRLGSGF